mmetsp:Transcript_9081/g.21320  ORF Transcript_9081/g.21320 Transcript_9081/m.21320 type:complete len:254 (-) Transcript_9081:62-823(-)|eukprot:CAMPEP_0185812222 /NCGR_PEP_ID=MMETSP1322-20130828/9041_1 /TAXON_ID=265543 /ORGANISM="Minutocellus polymorphus, Strain RCC2270" /LENGTH=253 /DNA_ID=CAMNT_0028508739 /DNA_START=117 /DNA_END=878 /DNA_ORIENTATION=+
MKTASVATFFAVAACSSQMGSAYERELNDERRLGMEKYSGHATSKFDKYDDIRTRCCTKDPEQPLCKCPVRNFEGWGGWWNFKAKWEDKCDTSIFAKSSIAAFASSNPDFSILAGLLKEYNLVEPLSGKGPFTVFAPTNDAFTDLLEKVDLGDIDVAAVLKYHVIAGSAIKAADLNVSQTPGTFNGATIKIDKTTRKENDEDIVEVKITDSTGVPAKVVIADNEASNGVVHAIDKVLIPDLSSGSSTSVEYGK